MEQRSVVVIGAGPAGLAAAIAAKENGATDILILERDDDTGGILRQCIHTGFGLHLFGRELSGPEYAHIFRQQADALGLEYRLDTMVLDITKDRVVTAVNREQGLFHVQAGAIVLAMGCRERTRGAIGISGFRPAGVYTAGTAQRYVNREGYLPGKRVVVLGSGDIGLIMARRMTLEGAKVEMVLEMLPYSGSLKRNIVQCLHDFDIPLLLSHTVVRILGRERVEGVEIARVDENRRPIPETLRTVPCDTLLLSVGLIPENELSAPAGVALNPATGGPLVDEGMETSAPGIFACGNVVHVHDLVDFVTMESRIAGRSAAAHVLGKRQPPKAPRAVRCGPGVRYAVPNTLNPGRLYHDEKLLYRVDNVYTDVDLVVRSGGGEILRKKLAAAAPGEMESTPLSEEFAARIREGDLELRLEARPKPEE